MHSAKHRTKAGNNPAMNLYNILRVESWMPKIRTGLIIIVTCIIACLIILVCETKQVIDYRGFPEPPSNLNGYFLSASTYRLVWSDNSENETGFDIHRSQGIIWSRLATVPGNTESYVDSLQQDSTTYSYFVTAFNASGNSTASNIHSVSVSTFGSPPDRPQNPSPQDQSKIHNLATDLRWECSDPDGDPLSYDIYFGTDSNPSLVEANLPSNTYSISELRAGTSYSWRIVARDVYSYETSSPIWSLIISELVLLGNYDTESYPGDVFVSADHAYMIDITPNLIIIDISDSRSPALASVFSLPDIATDIFVADAHAYVADSHSGLLIIDISNPASPISEGSYDASGRVQGVFVNGDYAYVTDDGPEGLSILNVADPGNPSLIGICNTPGNAYKVFVDGSCAYVADGYEGLQIIDISNPQTPTILGSCDTPGNAIRVFVAGDYAYVADYDLGLQMINVSNLYAPTLVQGYETPGRAIDINVIENRAYYSDMFYGLYILDVSDPTNPSQIEHCFISGFTKGLFTSGNKIYVTNSHHGLMIFQFNP